MSLVEEIIDGTGTDWDDDGSLAAWLAGPASMLQQVTDLTRDGEFPGWSVLFDVTRCPTYALPWLAQFVGVRLDPNGDDATWRAAITAEENFGRGVVERLKAAVRPFLVGTQTVKVAERDTSAYHLTVTVFAGELNTLHYNQLAALYPTYNDLAAAYATYGAFTLSTSVLLAALNAAKPAGLQLALVVADGLPPTPTPTNMLSAADATLEGGIGTWTAVTNCTVAASTAQAADGTGSLAMTASAAGDMIARTSNTAYPASAGVTYTAVMSFRAATAGRSVQAALAFFNSGGSIIGTFYIGTAVADTTTGFAQASVTAVAPAGTATVGLRAYVLSAASGEVHYVDKVRLSVGSV